MKMLELRKFNKLSQEEAAKKLGILRATYANYEAGKTQPDISTLCQIADYYGVSLAYLCDHKTKNQLDYGPIDNDRKMAHNILQSLPDSEFYVELGRLQIKADQLGIQY